jgi:hypothetical protein
MAKRGKREFVQVLRLLEVFHRPDYLDERNSRPRLLRWHQSEPSLVIPGKLRLFNAIT